MKWVKSYKEENKILIDEGIYFGKGVFETLPIFEKPVCLKSI